MPEALASRTESGCMTTGRLLILDDDETVGQTLLFAAQTCSFEARLCTTAASFLAELASWPATHLAIDLNLPGGSGREVLSRLAAISCGASVIVCSGAGGAELEAAQAEAKALGLHTTGVLTKPFRLTRLKALLAEER